MDPGPLVLSLDQLHRDAMAIPATSLTSQGHFSSASENASEDGGGEAE